jgi:alpha-galactosidase
MNYADIVQPGEMDDSRAWLNGMLAALSATASPGKARKPATAGDGAPTGAGPVAFSFEYAGKPSRDFLARWKVRKSRPDRCDGMLVHRIGRTDPRTGLAVMCEIKEYTDFPVIEWVLRLKNTSKRKTPAISNVRSLDIAPVIGPLPYLNYHTGDYCVADGYEPFRVSLAHGEEYRFAPLGGRPTNRAWPYFNLDSPSAGRGLIAVVGWAGQWAASYRGLKDGAVEIRAGQELTHFRLLPGEEVRTPLSVLMFYRGDRTRSQNLWRRWMMAHNLPRPGGKLPEPMLPAYTGRWFEEMGTATEETQIAFLDRYLEEGIRLDYWWMDAGWYPCFIDGKNRWPMTGTWEPDPTRFPRGLRAVCDHAHARGIKTLVWFEPERVVAGTWLGNKREWLLSPPTQQKNPAWHTYLLNLGNPKARRWLTDHTSKTLVEQGIDLYRQDFNIDPLPFWRAADAPDRQGIAEIRYVEGYLAFWSELRRRFPGMLIDSCASGGRRNDLETMRLSVPLHKTDYHYGDLPTKQAFHHSLSLWLPYYGAYCPPEEVPDTVDAYAFRSSLAMMTMLTHDLRRRDVNWTCLRAMTEEWRRLVAGDYFYGDYYPLTPYNRDQTRWIAWQFHRPDRGTGMVQAFRRRDCACGRIVLCLAGLDPDARYVVSDADAPTGTMTLAARELMERGLAIEAKTAPQAVIVTYARAQA